MSTSSFEIDACCDDLGPQKIVHVYDPRIGLHGMVVIDNTACGAAIGGVRMAADVSLEEVCRLARAMTLKNAAAGLPHGGGKAGIIADPSRTNRPQTIRTFARAIETLTDYIPGPDMGTDEECMAWIQDEIGRAVGLPTVLGGIPLDEIGATGFGLACCAEVAAAVCGFSLKNATMAIEGFGNVGKHAAKFLAKHGARLVAVSDSKGAIHDPDGINIDELIKTKQETGSISAYPRGQKISLAKLVTVPCDILIPAARPDCIHKHNAHEIKARLVLQGANIPATAEAETLLHQRSIMNVPDFIANAGGVICASVEYHGGTQRSAFEQIEQKIRHNTQEVLSRSQKERIEPRIAAVALAKDRVLSAMAYRK